jgi:hypothetical protein
MVLFTSCGQILSGRLVATRYSSRNGGHARISNSYQGLSHGRWTVSVALQSNDKETVSSIIVDVMSDTTDSCARRDRKVM